MADTITYDAVRDWLVQQNPDTAIKLGSPRSCLVARYLRTKYGERPHISVGRDVAFVRMTPEHVDVKVHFLESRLETFITDILDTDGYLDPPHTVAELKEKMVA